MKAGVDGAPPVKKIKHKSDNKENTSVTSDAQGAPPDKKHKSETQPPSKQFTINEFSFISRGSTLAGWTRCYHNAPRHPHPLSIGWQRFHRNHQLEHYTQYSLLNTHTHNSYSASTFSTWRSPACACSRVLSNLMGCSDLCTHFQIPSISTVVPPT